jgi:hypothetical protein
LWKAEREFRASAFCSRNGEIATHRACHQIIFSNTREREISNLGFPQKPRPGKQWAAHRFRSGLLQPCFNVTHDLLTETALIVASDGVWTAEGNIMDATSWHKASMSRAWAHAIERKSSWGPSKPSKA